jgi:uracil-DNA glycosylase
MLAKATFARCDDCPLRDRPVVAGWGDVTDRVIVGQAPGSEEVAKGKPFVGLSGQRLDRALVAAGVDRFNRYITNTVLCQADGSPPQPEAISACHDRLVREIQEKAPRKVMALGKAAAKAVTGDSRPIEQLRLLRPAPSLLDGCAEVRVTFHPSPLALNRHPMRSQWFDEDIRWLAEP